MTRFGHKTITILLDSGKKKQLNIPKFGRGVAESFVSKMKRFNEV